MAKLEIPKHIRRQKDDKVNTAVEMINASEEALWRKNPVEALKFERVETRKRMNWIARFTLSLLIFWWARMSEC